MFSLQRTAYNILYRCFLVQGKITAIPRGPHVDALGHCPLCLYPCGSLYSSTPWFRQRIRHLSFNVPVNTPHLISHGSITSFLIAFFLIVSLFRFSSRHILMHLICSSPV